MWGGLTVVALSYLTLQRVSDPILSRGLLWIGWVSAIPLVGLAGTSSDWRGSGSQAPGSSLLWWSLCLLLPLLVDTLIRRRFEWRLSLFAVAVWLLAMADGRPGSSLLSEFWHQFGGFLMAGAMALFLTWWGVQAKRTERINLGILGFGVVVLSYYFSNVMDKFGRSLSLLGLGALFFVLAFVLGKARRRLLNEIRPQSSGGEA